MSETMFELKSLLDKMNVGFRERKLPHATYEVEAEAYRHYMDGELKLTTSDVDEIEVNVE